MNEKPNLKDIYALFTRNPVLLPLIPGTKIINDKGWTATTWENTQNPNYQARLRNTTNVGILLGKNSSNLIFFDWDTQAALDWFLENNPRFKESFRVTGKGVGGQVGGYAQGDYPANAVFRVPVGHPLAEGGTSDDKGMVQVGSLRGDRLQSVLCGIHPVTKGHYSWPNDAEPITFNFESVVWHPDFVLPWALPGTASSRGNGSGPLSAWATECVSIDFLWKYFGFKLPRKNPSSSPFRDDNTAGHPSFSLWTDPETGKQIFKDFHDNHTVKGDSYLFYQLATGLDSKTAFKPFMEIANAILNGETPPAYEPVRIETEFYLPPVQKIEPSPIGEAAYQGFLGEWVRYVEPQTEANRENLLLQMAVTTGVVLGRYFYTFAGQDLFPNLFLVMLGPTGARKGTALVPVKKFFALAAPDWRGAKGSWKSGEALIHAVRDPRWSPTGSKLTDEGVADKRLLVEDTELIQLFRTSEWKGNTLMEALRDGWDSKETLATRGLRNPAIATAAHIGLVGHMTNEEFLLMDPGFITSGVINRITWGNAYRARLLPNVQPVQWPANLLEWFKDIYAYAYRPPVDIDMKNLGAIPETQHMPLDANAQLLWDKVYVEREETGSLADVFKRVLPQARKYASIYSICDKSPIITRPHLEAGLAIANYSKANARTVFANFGPNKNANRLLSALMINPDGFNLTGISAKVFNGKTSAVEIQEAIIYLTQNRLISTQGRVDGKAPVWRAVT